MYEFYKALLKGIATVGTQFGINRLNARSQNKYNEEMWQRHSSPIGMANELKKAGLSDAAIGQALTGYSGSGTTLQSASIENPQVNDIFSDMGALANIDKKQAETSLILTQAQVEELRKRVVNNQADVLAAEYFKIGEEAQKMMTEGMLNDQQYRFTEKCMNYLIQQEEYKAQKTLGEAIKLYQEWKILEQQQKINRAAVAKAELEEFMTKEFGVEKSDFDFNSIIGFFSVFYKVIMGLIGSKGVKSE